MSVNDVARQLDKLVKKKQSANLKWKFFLTMGLIFLVQVPLPPLPPAMAAPLTIFFSLLSIRSFVYAKRMPIRESLLLSQLHEGRLSLTLLCTHLDVDIPVGKSILRKMESQGMIQIDADALANDNEIIYRVQGMLNDEDEKNLQT